MNRHGSLKPDSQASPAHCHTLRMCIYGPFSLAVASFHIYNVVHFFLSQCNPWLCTHWRILVTFCMDALVPRPCTIIITTVMINYSCRLWS
ncbi:hypothetical protein C8Q72DRAFT_822585 [Fomitopsis betulina]|nr:hypothetical protein C8Q72DRAFT_822585 [Fomitopsis betulina]